MGGFSCWYGVNGYIKFLAILFAVTILTASCDKIKCNCKEYANAEPVLKDFDFPNLKNIEEVKFPVQGTKNEIYSIFNQPIDSAKYWKTENIGRYFFENKGDILSYDVLKENGNLSFVGTTINNDGIYFRLDGINISNETIVADIINKNCKIYCILEKTLIIMETLM